MEVVSGRIAIPRCRSRQGPPIDIVGIGVLDLPRLSARVQLRRLHSVVLPIELALTFMIGDTNFVDLAEGRLDLITGRVHFDDGEVSKASDDLFPSSAGAVAGGFSR